MANETIRGEEPEEEATGKETVESAEKGAARTGMEDETSSEYRDTNGEARPGTNVTESSGFGFTFEQQDVTPDLDPQLQHVLLSARAGRVDPTLVEQSEDGTMRVDVTAVLRDARQAVPGLEVTQAVGDIVTGSCEVKDIEAVRQHPNVVSLKGATLVRPELQFSVPEIRASAAALREGLPQGAATPDGAGVIVGVVDFGCDFAHENFRNQDGTTRLLFLWDQNGSRNSMSPSDYPYGREFNAQRINQALRSSDPYAFLSYAPDQGSHGTHVMDIAAGNGRGTGSPGVAPKADLIFVELVGSSRVDLQACKLEYSIVSPK